ncbi:MAG: hypothetical protein KAS39_04395, partial [Actinomycetia bacterium]|nr:hypothetical protein [Actinomycetes bacterium]
WKDPESKFRGATDAMLDSWDGMVSMMGDHWTQFRNLVMTEGGVFDWMKSGLRIVLDAVNRLKDEGKLAEWANKVGAVVVNAFNQIVVGVGYAVDVFNVLKGVWIGLNQAWSVFVGGLARGYEMIQRGNLMLAESSFAIFGGGQDPAAIREHMNTVKEFADFQFDNVAELQKEWEAINPWGTATKQFTGYKDAVVAGAEEIKRKRIAGEQETFVKPTLKKAEAVDKDKLKIQGGFDKAFDKATLTPYQYEMKQLDELVLKYEEAGIEKARIDQWYAIQREEILLDESERSIAEHKKMIEEMEAGYQTLFDDLVGLTDVIDNRLVDGFTSATMDFITGAKSMKQAFSEFSISFARDIGEMILKQTILNSLQGVMGGTGSGMFGGLMKMGASMFMADGGSVYGNRSYVVGENQAERFTSDRGGSRVVGANGPEMFKPCSKGTIDPSAQAAAPKVTIANLIDPSMISEYLNSSEGQDAIMNVISNQN